jgi:hypothetical protein
VDERRQRDGRSDGVADKKAARLVSGHALIVETSFC